MALSYCPIDPGGKGETPTHFGGGGGPVDLGVAVNAVAGAIRVAASMKGCGGSGSVVGDKEPEEVGVNEGCVLCCIFWNCCVKIRARSLPLSPSV